MVDDEEGSRVLGVIAGFIAYEIAIEILLAMGATAITLETAGLAAPAGAAALGARLVIISAKIRKLAPLIGKGMIKLADSLEEGGDLYIKIGRLVDKLKNSRGLGSNSAGWLSDAMKGFKNGELIAFRKPPALLVRTNKAPPSSIPARSVSK